jgi:5-methylcytosine-specific restriction enzyme subunit McrC
MSEIPIQNSWYLLLYAWDLSRWAGHFRGAEEESPSIQGLLARVLVEATHRLVRQQLGQQFSQRTQRIRGVRGRIELTPSMVLLARRAPDTVCTVPIRTIDTPRNQLIKATLRKLLAAPVSGKKKTHIAHLRGQIRSLLHAFSGVSPVQISSAALSRVQLGQSDRAYQLPMAICGLLHRTMMPTEEEGQGSLPVLMKDEIAFQLLFERFVRTWYRIHHPEWRQPVKTLYWWKEESKDTVKSKHALLPQMNADIILQQGTSRMVIDTKFYRSALRSNRFGTDRFRNTHLYQIYAYLHTQAHRGPLYRSASGMLLYPTVGRHLNETVRIQGHDIHLKTLDLAMEWPQIEERLTALLPS